MCGTEPGRRAFGAPSAAPAGAGQGRGERGTILVGVLALLVMLTGFLLVAAHNVVTDADAASKYRARTSAFCVAEAGLAFAFAQAGADSSWAGLAAPGKNCQEGSFTVSVVRTDASGAALPANQKRYIS
ncbi:MAG TPA: hypothetical protein VMS93_00035, partial [Candidatus Saccharimonadales bacterium]|nr:hypothetical protein [Candidatus Saccharimonadales bacterium]